MKKFTQNDIFRNDFITSPKYVISMQSGSLRINDQINQNYEKSSSISILDFQHKFIVELSNKLSYSGSYQYTSSIKREFVYATSSNGNTYPNAKTFHEYYTNYSTLKKIYTLKNKLKDYNLDNEYANLKYYFLTNSKGDYLPEIIKPNVSVSPLLYPPYFLIPSSSINFIEIPSIFYGHYIKPGSLKLNMYVSGTLTASAADVNKNGIIYQTLGGTISGTIGSIFYDDGIILLTGSQALSAQKAAYIQPLPQYTASSDSKLNPIDPINDYLKWIYFGSYISTEGNAPETKYELIFQGTNYIPTLMMMCHAEKNELYWSNNRTFIESGQTNNLFIGQSTSSVNKDGNVYYANTGSFLLPSDGTYKENNLITIKNTISSSFANYSASYEPQVFIEEIGIYDEEKNLIAIAKLANPVRKTKDLDYTFKLKLDM